MLVCRIVKEPFHTDPYDPLSVIGSTVNGGGRWNPPQHGVLYTATSPALALLETMVHFPHVGYSQLPSLHLLTIELPESAESIFWIDPLALPPYWRTGTLAETQTIFLDWLASPFSLALAVPSVIIDISYNLLIHPEHPLFGAVQLKHSSRLPLDTRLWP